MVTPVSFPSRTSVINEQIIRSILVFLIITSMVFANGVVLFFIDIDISIAYFTTISVPYGYIAYYLFSSLRMIREYISSMNKWFFRKASDKMRKLLDEEKVLSLSFSSLISYHSTIAIVLIVSFFTKPIITSILELPLIDRVLLILFIMIAPIPSYIIMLTLYYVLVGNMKKIQENVAK